MAFEITFLGKLYMADVALERMLLCVTSKMIKELANAKKRFLAMAEKYLFCLELTKVVAELVNGIICAFGRVIFVVRLKVTPRYKTHRPVIIKVEKSNQIFYGFWASKFAEGSRNASLFFRCIAN